MKKKEFPTYLNEQPSVVFGRNMRELMVIMIGMALAYAVWANLSALLPEPGIGILFCKILCVGVVLIATLIVTFVKIASRPLEEWALVGLFYYATPKIFLYMPFDDDEMSEDLAIGISQYQESKALAVVDDGFN
jgi:hypothetical protein